MSHESHIIHWLRPGQPSIEYVETEKRGENAQHNQLVFWPEISSIELRLWLYRWLLSVINGFIDKIITYYVFVITLQLNHAWHNCTIIVCIVSKSQTCADKESAAPSPAAHRNYSWFLLLLLELDFLFTRCVCVCDSALTTAVRNLLINRPCQIIIKKKLYGGMVTLTHLEAAWSQSHLWQTVGFILSYDI